MIREQKRTVDRSIRSLDRERTQLERQEKQLIAEIKKNAKAGQMVRSLLHLNSIVLLTLHIVIILGRWYAEIGKSNGKGFGQNTKTRREIHWADGSTSSYLSTNDFNGVNTAAH